MEIETQLLQATDLFKNLEPTELEKIASISHFANVKEGEVLMERNQPVHTFFIVSSGNYMLTFEKNKTFTLHERGDCIGWAAIAASSKYISSGVALTDGEVLSIPVQDFMELIQRETALGEKIMNLSAKMVDKRMPFYNVADK